MTLNDYLFLYLTGAVLIALVGLLEYWSSYTGPYKRKGARMVLVAPVWPVALLVVTVLAAARFLRNLWKAAWA